MAYFLPLMIAVAIYGCLYVIARRFRPKWAGQQLWLACCLGPALLSLLFAIVAAGLEPAVPANYDPTHDPNEGRLTFLILLVFGAAIPVI